MENNNKTIKQAFISLVNAWRNDETVLTMVERNMENLLEYVNAVYLMEMQLPILSIRLDGEEFCDAVQELDSRRRRAHDAAISATAALCRMANTKNVQPMFNGIFDMENRRFDRNIVGDFCMEAVSALVMDRSKRVTISGMLEMANK